MRETCEQCGRKLKPPKQKRFCSRRCLLQFLADLKIKQSGIPRLIKCQNCKKEFNRGKQPWRKYCSRACYSQSLKGKKRPKHSAFMKRYMANHPEQKVGHHLKGKTYEEAYGQNRGHELRERRKEHLIKARSILPPTKPERKIMGWLDKLITYTGDNRFHIRFQGGQNKNPDFKIKGRNAVIEVFGDYWHRDESPQKLIDQYAMSNFQCLVLWEHEIIKTPLQSRARLMAFLLRLDISREITFLLHL